MKISLYFCQMTNWAVYLLFGLILTGCYTFTGTTLPAHLKTIQVEPVINETEDPVLAEKLTQAIINGFQLKSSLRAVNENGHCQFTATLKNYSHEPYNTSGSKVTEYRIDMTVHVKFYDNVKNKMIFEEASLPGFGTYSVERNETETNGQQKAIESIVEIILDNTISGW